MESPEVVQPEIQPGCSICGRRDASLRYVTYPFVFSVVVMTFRRAFTGLWCGRHQFRMQFLASMITSIFGWFGIPFGFVFTPLALFQLAKGGIRNKELNSQLLVSLGKEKDEQGDYREALKCYEASLRFHDSEDVNARLARLHSMQPVAKPLPSSVMAFASFVGVPVFIFLVGVIVGLLDFGLSWLISGLFPSSGSIFVIILSWAPLVMMIFLGLLLLVNLLRWVVRINRCSQTGLASGLAFFSSLSMVYAVATGETLGKFIAYVKYGLEFVSPLDFLVTLGAVFTHGGIYQLAEAVNSGQTWGVILVSIILIMAVFSIIVALSSSHDETRIQARLAKSEIGDTVGSLRPSFLPAWGGLGAVLAAMAFLYFVVFPQKSTVDALNAFDHIIDSDNYTEQGNYPAAAQSLESAVQLRPGIASTYVRLGYAHYYQGELEGALEAFQTAVRLDRDSADAHIGLGWTLYQMGENADSVNEFNLALQANPGNLDAYLGLGWAYLESDVEKSILSFNNALAINSNNSEAYIGLGTAWYIAADFDKAQNMLQKAIELDPNNSWGQTILGYVQLNNGEEDLAIQSFKNALAINPKDYDAYWGLGKAFLNSNNIDQAINNLQTAIQIDPDKADAYLTLGMVDLMKADYEAAIKSLEAAVQLEPKSGAPHAYLAVLYYQLADPDKAKEELQFALDLITDDGDTGYAIGYALSEMYRFHEAETYLLTAIESTPGITKADLYLDLAVAHIWQGDFEQANQMIDLASEINPRSSDVFVTQARVLIEQQDLDKAVEALQRAVQLDPENSYAHAVLSFVYFQAGKMDLAVKEAEIAVGYDSYSSRGYTQLAFAYHAEGKLTEALDAARKAVQYGPTNDLPHYILALCLMENNQKAEAVAEFDKFLQHYWDRAYVRDYKSPAEQYLQQLGTNP